MAHWRTFLDAETQGGRYLPWKEVARATGLSRTTAWRLQKRDDFPPPYAISPGRVGYREEEVEAWRRSRDPSGSRTRRAPQDPRDAVPSSEASAADPGAAPEPPRKRPPVAPPPSAKPRRRSQHARAIAQQIRFDF